MSIVEWLRHVAPRSRARRRKVRRLGVELLEERCVLAPEVTVLPIAPQEGALFNGTVATFIDPAPGQAGTYTALINWGDGSAAQTVTPTGPTKGVFTVSGSHTYAEEKGYTVTVSVTNTSLADSWTTEASMPTGRWGLAAALGANGQIYAFGGANGEVIFNTVEAYNPATNSWTTKTSMPTARDTFAAVTAPNGLIYTFGGNTTLNGSVSTVEAYNPATDTWATEASMPTARSDEAAALGADGKIYVFGGVTNNGSQISTVEAYDPATNSWTTRTSMPTARDGLTAAPGPDGLIYVIGGFNFASGVLSTVEAYNPATDSWATKTSMPTARSDLAAAPGPDGQIYVVGGDNNRGTIFNTAEAYNPAADTWATKTNMPTARNYLAAALGPDGQIYAIGGQPGTSFGLSTVEALNTNTGTGRTPITVIDQAPVVSAVPIAPQSGVVFSGPVATITDPGGNEPAANYSASINWGDGSGTDTITPGVSLINGRLTVSGRHIYAVPGGYTITVTVTDDGGISGVKTWTTQAGMPNPLSALAAAPGPNGLLYTFGGAGNSTIGNGAQNTVQAYDPAADTWTTRAGMPTARYGLAAAPGPDGLLYAIGGFPFGEGITNATEAYDPATDTWATHASMPTARANLAAALGRNGLIYVFGGVDVSGAALNTVEAYNPATDTWTTETSMPTARENLAAVLAPNGLIYVFGGDMAGTSAALSTVEAYNPATNTWTAEAGMPTARKSLAAVLGTDGLIYVLGGSDNTPGIVSTVEAYNPATNTWTTAPGMSTARSQLAAAPGPNGLIYAFGGVGSSGKLSSVEAFRPAGLTGSKSAPITVILPPPSAPVLTPGSTSGPPGITNVITPTFTGTAPPGTTVTIFSDGVPVGSSTMNGTYQITTTPLPDGVHQITAQATDVNGNRSPLSGATAVTIDATPPTSTISFPTAATFTTTTWAGVVNGTAADNLSGVASVQVSIFDSTAGTYFNGTGFVSSSTPLFITATGTTPWSLTLLVTALTGGHTYTVTSRAKDVAGNVQTTPATVTFTFASPPTPTPTPTPTPDRVSVYADGVWTLDLGVNGTNPVTFFFGYPGDQGAVGDWSGDGFDAVGTYRVDTKVVAPDGKYALLWSLDYNDDRAWDAGDVSFVFGEVGDQVVLGDWTGDGKTKVGVVRPGAGGGLDWSLDLNDTPAGYFNDPTNYQVYHFGYKGDQAITGDWTGDGKDKIGVVRTDTTVTQATGGHPLLWSLDHAGTGVYVVGSFFTFGTSLDVVLTGDWNGDGKMKPGVAGPDANGIGVDVLLDLDATGMSNPPTKNYYFGAVNDIVFRGDWTGDGRDKIGVVRPANATTLQFTLDSKGDGTYDASNAVFTLPGQDSAAIFIGDWKP
jgi:N-acetylneuraminic acid mutarotase